MIRRTNAIAPPASGPVHCPVAGAEFGSLGKGCWVAVGKISNVEVGVGGFCVGVGVNVIDWVGDGSFVTTLSVTSMKRLEKLIWKLKNIGKMDKIEVYEVLDKIKNECSRMQFNHLEENEANGFLSSYTNYLNAKLGADERNNYLPADVFHS